MAHPMSDRGKPMIEPVDTEFSRLPPEERARLTDEWLDGVRRSEPVDLGVSGAELVAEARREMGWD